MTDCFEIIAYFWSYCRRISSYRKLQPNTPLVPQQKFFKNRKYFADFNFRRLILTSKFRKNWTTRRFPILRYIISIQIPSENETVEYHRGPLKIPLEFQPFPMVFVFQWNTTGIPFPLEFHWNTTGILTEIQLKYSTEFHCNS